VRYYLRFDVLPAVVRIAIDALRDVLTRGVAKPLAEVFMGSATCPCSVVGAAASTSRSHRVAAFQALLGSDIKQMMEDVGAQRTSMSSLLALYNLPSRYNVGGAQKLLNDKLAAIQGLHFHAIINSKPRKKSVLHVATHNCERCCPRLSHKEMSDAVIVMVKTISAAASQLWTVTSLHNLLWSHAGDLLCGLTTTLPSDVLEKLRSSHGWTCCGALLYHAPDDVCKSCPPRGADPPRCHPSCRVSRSGGPAWPTNIVLRLAHHPVVVPQFSSLRCAYEWLGERASAVAPNAVALVQRAAGRGEVAVPSRHFLPAPTGPAGEMFVGPYAVGGASWPPSLPASWVRLVPEETQDVWRAIKKLHGRASLARRVCRSIMLACASALRLARSSGWRCVDGAVFGQWQRQPKTLVARSARDLLADAGIPDRKAQGFAATTLEALLCVLRARGAGSFVRSLAPADDDLIPLKERMMPDEPTVDGLVQCEEADYVSGGED